MTIFKKIIDREIPAKIVFEDEKCLAFRDINPKAPVHILIVPKKEIPTLQDVQDEDAALMGHILTCIPKIATAEKIAADGYRVIVNCRSHGGQEVNHLHFHLLGGRPLKRAPE